MRQKFEHLEARAHSFPERVCLRTYWLQCRCRCPPPTRANECNRQGPSCHAESVLRRRQGHHSHLAGERCTPESARSDIPDRAFRSIQAHLPGRESSDRYSRRRNDSNWPTPSAAWEPGPAEKLGQPGRKKIGKQQRGQQAKRKRLPGSELLKHFESEHSRAQFRS